ncbi:hypothetical protein F5B20DRAFT_560147 [Whalleya microplaca]|nr:hypothetical protein F5B20DRAFT_560147 [Whalleya microplaca]
MLGVLSMALRNGFLSVSEANAIVKDMRESGRRHHAQNTIHTVRASFMVDIELAMTNPKDARVEILANAFHEQAIFHEFTRQDELR